MNSQHRREELLHILAHLESELRASNLWQSEWPSSEALASAQPFCIDTLNFVQWLQFVFIEKLRQLLAANAALPTGCSVLPMAQEYFSALRCDSVAVLKSIAEIDQLLA